MASDSNVKIDRVGVESLVNEQNDMVQDVVLAEYVTTIDRLKSRLSESKGSFINELKNEMDEEKNLVSSIAEVFVAMGDYITRATNDICDYDSAEAAGKKIDEE